MAADLFTVEVWTRRGRQRFLVLFFIELAPRKVEIAGIASTDDGLGDEPEEVSPAGFLHSTLRDYASRWISIEQTAGSGACLNGVSSGRNYFFRA